MKDKQDKAAATDIEEAEASTRRILLALGYEPDAVNEAISNSLTAALPRWHQIGAPVPYLVKAARRSIWRDRERRHRKRFPRYARGP